MCDGALFVVDSGVVLGDATRCEAEAGERKEDKRGVGEVTEEQVAVRGDEKELAMINRFS